MGLENVFIKLLGVPAIDIEGRTITSFRSNRIPALLGLLASRPGAWQRERVASELWPDHMASEGRHNLRQILLYIKQLLGDDVLIAGRNTVELAPDCPSDLVVLLRVNHPVLSPAEKIEAASKAIGTYRGEFLQGCEDDWVYPIRSICAQAYVSALLLLSEHFLPSNPGRALELAERAIQAEPYLESARAAKIHALKKLGEQASAHKEFTNYRDLLASELGIEPSNIAQDALKQADKSIDMAEKTRSDVDEIGILLSSHRPRYGLDLAISTAPFWRARGQHRLGIETLTTALKANDKNSSSDSYLLGKVALAELLYVAGNSYEAKEIVTETLPKLGKNIARIRALNLLGQISSYSYQPLAGAGYIKQGLNLANAIGEVEEQIDAYRMAAEISFQLEESVQGEEYSNACLELARQIGDWQSFAHAASMLAMIRHRTGHIDDAIAAVHLGLNELADKQSNLSTNIRVRFHRVLEEMGDIHRAEEGYRQGIQELHVFGDQVGLAIALTYLGDLLTFRAQYAGAVEAHKEALAIRQQLQERLGEATSLRGLGRAYRMMGQLEDARIALRESARLFQACDTLPGHASALLELAYLTKELDQSEMALRIATRARDLLMGMSKNTLQTIGPRGGSAAEEADRLVKSLQK